jgi:hypothetical protein
MTCDHPLWSNSTGTASDPRRPYKLAVKHNLFWNHNGTPAGKELKQVNYGMCCS